MVNLKNISKTASKFLALAIAAAMLVTFMPVGIAVEAANEEKQVLPFEEGSFAIAAGSGGILLNEKKAVVNGGILSNGKYACNAADENVLVNGKVIKNTDAIKSTIPEFTSLINNNAEYNFRYDEDITINDSSLNLSEKSFYCGKNVNIDHTQLVSKGNITAENNITMELYGQKSAEQQAVIMSQNGDINVSGADISFCGVLYAPNGKIVINAKNIDFEGEIYAKEIEINGTSLNVTYKNFIPDALTCRANDKSAVTVQMGKKLTLNGYCNYDDASLEYTAADSQKKYVTITNEKTLEPEIVFSETGDYEITLTAEKGSEKVTDKVKVSVTFSAVVNYTSTEDFKSGDLTGLDCSEDKLKPAQKKSDAKTVQKNYTLDAENGISVKSTQSSDSLSSASDTLDIGYKLNGYGKTTTGNGSDVILVIDNSGSVSNMRSTIQETAGKILGYMGPNDRFGITSLDRVNTPLTDSKKSLTENLQTYNLTSGSNYGNGLKVALSMFDEKSKDRNKYFILLADGENDGYDDATAMEAAESCAQQGIKIYSFEINPFSNDFRDTSTMQQIAIDTKGAYKLCPDAATVEKFMLKMANVIYNVAARDVTFTTTVMNPDWLDIDSLSKAPDTVTINDDGSETLCWKYNTFDIGQAEKIELALNTKMLSNSGYRLITKDNRLISYDDSGNGSVVYLDNIIVGKNDYESQGTWTSSVYDSEKTNCQWSLVEWNADYRGNSAIDVFLSTSEDGENFSEPVRVSNGQKLNISGRYLKTSVEMKTSDDGAAPVLYDLTVYSNCKGEKDKTFNGEKIKINGAENVYAGRPIDLWLDLDGDYENVSDISWSINGEKDSAEEGKCQFKRQFVFDKEGKYTITVKVKTGKTITESSVNITVLPAEKLYLSESGTEFVPLKMTVSETPEYVTANDNFTVNFNISFDNPEQAAWVRVLYNEVKDGQNSTVFLGYVDESDENKVSIRLPSNYYSEHLITIQAYDWYGNLYEEKRTVKIDRYVPEANLSANKSSAYVGEPVIITATSKDNVGIDSSILTVNDKEISLDENNQYEFIPDKEGNYKFVYKVTDKAGNSAEKYVSVRIYADNNAPYVNIGGSSSVTLGNTIKLTASASDGQTGLDTWSFKCDGKEIVSFDSSKGEVPGSYVYEFKPEKVGTYVFTAEAKDKAGNVNKTRDFTVNCNADRQLPYVSISPDKTEIYAGDKVTVKVTANDNVSVSELKFYVDGTEQKLDENGEYVYISDDKNIAESGFKMVEFSAVAKDNAGNEGKASRTIRVNAEDNTRPEIDIAVPDTFEINAADAYMTVKVTDNKKVAKTEIYVNNQQVKLDANKRYYFDTSKLCEYTISVNAYDDAGNASTNTKTVKIVDTQSPVVELSSDKETYTEGEIPAVVCKVTDNVKVASVSAQLNGNKIEYDIKTGKLNLPEYFAAGEYKISVTAEDESGNKSETAECTFTVEKAPVVENPQIVDVSHSPEKLITGVESKITVKTKGGSGKVTVSVKADGNTLEYDSTNDCYLFTPYKTGKVTLDVHAEDELGNSDDKQYTLDVNANPAGHYLKMDAPITAKVNENIDVVVYSTDGVPFDDVTLYAGNTKFELEKGKDGNLHCFLSANSTGILKLKATGKNFDGTIETVEAEIQITSDFSEEIKKDDMKKLLEQTSETKPDDELKKVIAGFKSPVDAYEYVYNNIKYECYVDSRRGAVGAYQLSRGNDTDQASLLIGMLREMGYPAKYANTTIQLNEKQTENLLAMTDWNSATGMIASSGRKANTVSNKDTGEKSLKMNEVYVMAYVPQSALGETDESKKNLGVWVKLDTAIKDSKIVKGYADEQDYADIKAADDNLYNSYKGKVPDKLLDGMLKEDSSEDNVLYERQTIQKNFKTLPQKLQYTIVNENNVNTFSQLPDNMCDRVRFFVETSREEIDHNFGTYKISELFGKRVTIQHVGNTEGQTIFEMSSYDLQTHNFVPALTIDGQIVSKAPVDDEYGGMFTEYYGTWHIGKKHKLYTTLYTGGKQQETIEDDLAVGSTYAFTLDTGGISMQSIKKSYDEMLKANPSDPNDPAYPTKSTYYNEDKIGTFLAYMGNAYSMMCDIQDLVTAEDNNIELGSNTKLTVTSYDICPVSTVLGGSYNTGVSRIDGGYFQTDVDFNSVYPFSRTGDEQTRNKYMFSSNFYQSYLESLIWETQAHLPSVSTEAIFNIAVTKGADLIFINKNNFDEAIAKVSGLESDELKEITDDVKNKGYTVIIPECRITARDWKGTGYIVADFDNYNSFEFKISGGLNGGSNEEEIKLNPAKPQSYINDFNGLVLEAASIKFNFDTEKVICSLYSLCNFVSVIALNTQITKLSQDLVAVETAACGNIVGAVTSGVKLVRGAIKVAKVAAARYKALDELAKYIFEEQDDLTTIRKLGKILSELVAACFKDDLNSSVKGLCQMILGKDLGDMVYNVVEYGFDVASLVNG